jgi:16S rRNA (guanine966-N2)-methyltransferase
VRIVTGKWRGRRLRTPRGQTVRPTADRVREAIFNILGGRTEEATVLDLFAGTGALGLEALSRGAKLAVLVESDPRTFTVLRSNVRALEATEAKTLPMECQAAVRFLRRHGFRFDLVFLDPPYGRRIAERSAGDLAAAGLLAPGGTVVVEEAVRAEESRFPTGWERIGDRRYGDTRVMIFRGGREAG